MLDSEWDLLVIDEAHHLRWAPNEASIEYSIVELFAKVTKGLLLLTATPEQLGRTGHFARLKLLDPNRFHNYETNSMKMDLMIYNLNNVFPFCEQLHH